MLRIVLTLLLALSGIGAAIAAANHFPDTLTRDVVIIGGGSSGTDAATRLTRLGYDVVVIEKSDHSRRPGQYVRRPRLRHARQRRCSGV
jgi:NADPH-dependent glutamate synthase beta subunit-like oxidoreductase